jgi:hypothetical protein
MMRLATVVCASRCRHLRGINRGTQTSESGGEGAYRSGLSGKATRCRPSRSIFIPFTSEHAHVSLPVQQNEGRWGGRGGSCRNFFNLQTFQESTPMVV